MLLLDGVDGVEHVPVDGLSAGRSGERSLVNPSIPEVQLVQQLSKRYFSRGSIRILVEPQRIEEFVDDVNLFNAYASIVEFSIEKDAHCRSVEALVFRRQMNCVHFKVVPSTIYGVL